MAASLWRNILHLLQYLWISLCKLGRRSRRDSTTILPLVSPPMTQGIIIDICAPPEDLLTDAPPTLNFPDISRKQEISKTPSSSLNKPRDQDDEKRQKRAAPEISMPNIRVENWDDAQFKTPEMQNLPSSVPVSQPPSGTPAPDDPCLALPLLSSSEPSPIPPNIPRETPSLNSVVSTPPVEPHKVPEPRVSQIVCDGQRRRPTKETPKMAFEPITYTYSALSAVSDCTFWDVPSNDTACMVPLPLYSSTPPRPHSRPSTDQKTTRLSLLPYADLFDFSMYSSRVSQHNSGEFLFSSLPPDITTPLTPATEVETIAQTPDIAYRDQYRSSAYSKPTSIYAHKSSTTPTKPGSTINRFSSRKHLGEISLNFVTSNSPPTKRTSTESATGVLDSSFSTYSQLSASSGDLSMKSLKDIGTCLHAACDDLSRRLWMDEEFVRLHVLQ